MKQKNAILILEAPWKLRANDQNTVSVLPFFEGLERLSGKFDLYHSHFYESTSFSMALDNLTRVEYERCYIYIACHGTKKQINDIDMVEVLEILNTKAKLHNVVGVVFGACLVGSNIEQLINFMKSSSTKWCFAYKCAVDWFDGTMLDLAIFRRLLNIREPELSSEIKILDHFKHVLRFYKPESYIGWHDNEHEDEEDVIMNIEESFTLTIHAGGQGKKPKDYSDHLFPEME